jgi:hypothetical protein
MTIPMPPRLTAIVKTFWALHPELANGSEDQRRALTRMMIEQIVFEFPTDGYGGKSADPSRPFGKDSIALLRPDGRLFACDWQNGTTRLPHADLNFEDITGQNFIHVPGVNHLGDTRMDPLPPPRDLQAAIDALSSNVEMLRAELAQTNADLAALVRRPLPLYRGTVFGITITLQPYIAKG